MRNFDIAIVGAGPAGTTCATMLARSGLHVAMFDRADFPRDKTCGDGITPRGSRVLARLGIYEPVRLAARAHHGVTIRGLANRSFTVPFERNAESPSDLLVLPRLKLDEILLNHALATGPTFFAGTKIVEVTDQDGKPCELRSDTGLAFQADIVIFATGAESQLLRASGLLSAKPPLEHAARAYFEGVKNLDRNVTLFFDGVDLPGYGWIFPISDTAANIGCGVFAKGTVSQAQRLRTLVETHPLLREILTDAYQVGAIKAYPLRTDFHPDFAGQSRRFCVGEAAGLVNPVSGEGIDYALESAEFMANAVLAHWDDHLRNQNILATYRKSLTRRFDRRFRFYRWVQRHCLSGPAMDQFLTAVERSPVLRQCLVDGLFGRSKLSGYMRPSVLLPGIALVLRTRLAAKTVA